MTDKDIRIKYEQEHVIPTKFLKTCSKEMLDYIQNRFNDSTCDKESLLRIIYNVIERPVCTCGNPTTFVGKPSKLFTKYCSNKCKFDNTNMVERHRQGCINKYGVDNISKLESIKKKKEQTFIKHFGTKNNFGRKEVSNTIKQKYGVDNVSQLEYIKRKKIETQHKRGTIGKSISTAEQQLYNKICEIYPDSIQQYTSIYYPYKCDIYIPNVSNELLERLNIIPSKTDFGLYIEYNGFWTHGKHIFDKNNILDCNELNYWIYKGEFMDIYNNAVHVWSILDPQKRKTAKENNLNFIELWNNSDIQNFIKILV